MNRWPVVMAGLFLALIACSCDREPGRQETAATSNSASNATASPAASPTPPIPERTGEEPSCRTGGAERDPTEEWVAELEARADATGEAEDIRKAMKAALLVLVDDGEDCWDVRDGFDALCGKPGAPSVTIECQQWWDRALKVRSEQRAKVD